MAFRGCMYFACLVVSKAVCLWQERKSEAEIKGRQTVQTMRCLGAFQSMQICEQNNRKILKHSEMIEECLPVKWGGLSCVQLCLVFQLFSVLREVSYLSGSQMGDIPPTAAAIYSSKELYRQMVANLELMVNRYNKILKTVLEVEYPLIQEELQDIDLRLKEAEETLNWKMEGELSVC